MISPTQLSQWIDFLQNQIVALDAAYLAKMGKPHVANVELVAFLKVNDEMAREKIERAVAAFGLSEAWPLWLTGDQIVNLTHRANCAKGLLQSMVSGTLPRNTPKSAPRHPLQEIQIHSMGCSWTPGKLSGPMYWEGLTNSYLAER